MECISIFPNEMDICYVGFHITYIGYILTWTDVRRQEEKRREETLFSLLSKETAKGESGWSDLKQHKNKRSWLPAKGD